MVSALSPVPRSLTEQTFKGWRSYELRQGPLVLHIVPQVGGRLMGIAFDGFELCFVHPQLQGQTFDGSAQAWPALCADWPFPLWGGGKTWIAPESDWPDAAPHRDLDSCAWEVQETWCTDASMGVALQSPVCTLTRLQLGRRLSLSSEAPKWTVEHLLTNHGVRSIRCGIWDVLMLRQPGVVRIPLVGPAEAAVVALPGKPGVAELQQAGILALSDQQARIACSAAKAFKLGFASATGQLSVEFSGHGVRYARSSPASLDQSYAHSKPLEVFNAPLLPYFEVETHSPLATLQPGQSLRYRIDEHLWTQTEPSPFV